MIVDRWFTEGYIQDHEAGRERRMAATGPTHHQGSHSLGAYKQAWVREFLVFLRSILHVSSNHLVVFLAVGVTWWAVHLQFHGIWSDMQG